MGLKNLRDMERINPFVYAGLERVGQNAYLDKMVAMDRSKPEDIISNLCYVFNIEKWELLSPKRLNKLVFVRFIAMREIRANFPTMALKAIGNIFGRDHSTVIYGLDQYKALLAFDNEFKSMVNKYRNFLIANAA